MIFGTERRRMKNLIKFLILILCGVALGKIILLGAGKVELKEFIQEIIIEKVIEVEKEIVVEKDIEVIKIVKEPVYVKVLIEQDIFEVKELGEFKITYYCSCIKCCGKDPSHPEYGITYSGAKVREGVTIAVDPKVIPLGSYVYIDGIGFRVAQDTGRLIKGNRIDVYLSSHKRALKAGVDHLDVYVLEVKQ